MYLELTRAVVLEAFKQLRGQRRIQTNLAEILGATRNKMLTNGRVYPVKCPRTYCYARDTFHHKLERYSLTEHVERGPDATPFLVRMAKITLLPHRGRRISIFTEATTQLTKAGAGPLPVDKCKTKCLEQPNERGC